MSGSIPARPGLEVFVNQSGTISMKQEDALGDDPAIVIVCADDVDKLIGFLKAAQAEVMNADPATFDRRESAHTPRTTA